MAGLFSVDTDFMGSVPEGFRIQTLHPNADFPANGNEPYGNVLFLFIP